jgi:hypothetical protein
MGSEDLKLVTWHFNGNTSDDLIVESSWNVMAQVDARERRWRRNWRMEWVASTLHTTSKHGVSSITTADTHTSAASSRLNWPPRRFKWTRPFRRKTKSGFCACAITFQTQSTYGYYDTSATAPSATRRGTTVVYLTPPISLAYSGRWSAIHLWGPPRDVIWKRRRWRRKVEQMYNAAFNPLNAELSPICHLLALLGAHHIVYFSRISVNMPNRQGGEVKL